MDAIDVFVGNVNEHLVRACTAIDSCCSYSICPFLIKFGSAALVSSHAFFLFDRDDG